MKISENLKIRLQILNSKAQAEEDILETDLLYFSQLIQRELPNYCLINDIYLIDLLNIPFDTDFTCYKGYYTTTPISELYNYSPKSMAVILGCLIKNEMQFITWEDCLKNKNMERIISLFNFISRLVEHSLFPKSQKQFLFWEKVCQFLLMAKNLYGLKCVACAMTSVVTTRNYDEQDFSEELKVLIEYTKEDNNFDNFRKLHVNVCLPYIGIFIKDIVYTFEQCKRDLEDPRMLDLISEFENYKVEEFPGWNDFEFTNNDYEVLQIVLSYSKVSDEKIYDVVKNQTFMDKLSDLSSTLPRPNSRSRPSSHGSSKASSPSRQKSLHGKSQSENTGITPLMIRRISQKAMLSSSSRSEIQGSERI
eukprot:NODE_23_length_38171_cov_0.318108.p11 type:complete len:364 gc:universal NODE_23_length_38171_cov_0.318108:34865-35956(+)